MRLQRVRQTKRQTWWQKRVSSSFFSSASHAFLSSFSAIAISRSSARRSLATRAIACVNSSTSFASTERVGRSGQSFTQVAPQRLTQK